jgi:hypothetical protein
VSIAEQSRRSPLHDQWAVAVKQRAHWCCEGCGMSSEAMKKLGGRLEAAHILPYSEYPERRYDVSNGKALCTFRNRRHPEGLGNGFGCHNAMSGHWGHAYGVMPGVRLAKRHKFLNLVLGMPVWTLLVIANAQLRYYAFLRPYTLGLPVSGRDFLTAAGILVGLYLASVGAVDFGLRHRFVSRGARGILHGVVRLVRRTHHAKEPQHQG